MCSKVLTYAVTWRVGFKQFCAVWLHGKQIVPEKCKYEVLTTKIEIRLVKAEAINWTSLEYSKEVTVRQNVNVPSGESPVVYCGSTWPLNWEECK